MQPALIDTDILSRFLRNDAKVVDRFRQYIRAHGHIAISILTYYEIKSGLLHRDARHKLNDFAALTQTSLILPLSQDAADHAARLYAATRKAGTPVDDIDILIAGTALAHGRVVVTGNTTHFDKLPGVQVENWAA
jgi:tRNA(fMet)-specific endonuclease VapC